MTPPFMSTLCLSDVIYLLGLLHFCRSFMHFCDSILKIKNAGGLGMRLDSTLIFQYMPMLKKYINCSSPLVGEQLLYYISITMIVHKFVAFCIATSMQYE